MGIRSTELTDAIKERMDPAEKKRLGKAGETTAEVVARKLLELERHDHNDFANYLLLKGIEFEHDNPTKRSTARKGWPDFRVFYGPPPRTLFIEFKRGPNKLTREQEVVRRYLEACGYPYAVCSCLSQAIEAVHTYLR